MAIRWYVRVGLGALALALAASAGCVGAGGNSSGGQGAATVSTATVGSGAGTGTTGGSAGALAGAPLVARKCTRCHSIDRIQKAKKTRDGWTKTVSRMQSNGLQVSEGERAAIIEYLTLRDGGR